MLDVAKATSVHFINNCVIRYIIIHNSTYIIHIIDALCNLTT